MKKYTTDTNADFNRFVNEKIARRLREHPAEAVAEILASDIDPNIRADSDECPICGERSTPYSPPRHQGNVLCPRHLAQWRVSRHNGNRIRKPRKQQKEKK